MSRDSPRTYGNRYLTGETHVPDYKTLYRYSRSRAGFNRAGPGVDSFGNNDMDADGKAGYV